MTPLRKRTHTQFTLFIAALTVLASLTVPPPARALPAESLTEAIEKVMPSVVRVRAVRRGRMGALPPGEGTPRPPQPNDRAERITRKIPLSKSSHPCVVANYFNPQQPLCALGLALVGDAVVQPFGLGLPPGIDQILSIDAQGVLLVTGTDAAIRRLEEIISLIDVPIDQVEIEALFVLVNPKDAGHLGVDWSLSKTPSREDKAKPGGSVQVGYVKGDARQMLNDLTQQDKAKIINAPRVVTINNAPAILVSEIVAPIEITQVVTDQSGNPVTARLPIRVPVTHQLRVVPAINQDDTVTMSMSLSPQFSGFKPTTPSGTPVLHSVQPAVSALATVKDGTTMVLGSMIDDQTGKRVTYVSNLPGIGPLFRNRLAEDGDKEMFIFITPHVIHRAAEGAAPPAGFGGGGGGFAPMGVGHLSEGAGVVWRADGYIVTTFSIVNRAERIEVTLNDGRMMDAKLVGIDPMIDLALLKVDAEKLPTVTPGDASKAKVGEPVFAIGHPAGFTGTVITGIISGLNRTLNLGNQSLMGVIQTDLAIAPGFSGGPLGNGRGEVIGINVAQFRPSRPGFSPPFEEGLGGGLPQPNLSFAVPISEVKRSVEELIAHGRVFRPFLGVQLQDVDADRQRQAQLPDRKGAFVANVPPDSPARRAGIRPGDVIRRIAGKEISNAAAATEEIRSHKAGDKVAIEIWRDGAARPVEVTFADLPREPLSPPPPFPQPPFRPGGPEFPPRSDPRFPPDMRVFARPTVRILAPRANETVKGNLPIRLAVSERERFGWLGVWVDDQFVTVVRLSDEPILLDTTKLPNGAHTLRVKVFNLNNDAAPGAEVRVKVENEK